MSRFELSQHAANDNTLLVTYWQISHLSDLSVTVPEVELHYLLVDVLLAIHGLRLLLTDVQAAMDETGVVGVEPRE